MTRALALALVLPFLAACSDQAGTEDGDHVWTEQTDTLEKAEDAARQVEQVTNERLQELQQQ